MSPNRYTTQSCTCEAADLTLHVCKWSPNESWWKLLQAHYWEGPISAGIGTPIVEQNQTSHNERGNRSLLVRRLIRLRNPRGFQLRDRNGGSPDSIVYVSKGKTVGWSLLVRGRGSRSCVLVTLVICCVWRANYWSIRELFGFLVFVSHGSHFFIIWLEITRWSFYDFFLNCKIKNDDQLSLYSCNKQLQRTSASYIGSVCCYARLVTELNPIE
jgi:hypothetical protein